MSAIGALLVFGLLLWLVPAYLVYVHAKNRGRDAGLWAIVVLVGGLLGVLLYVLLADSVGQQPQRGPGRAGGQPGGQAAGVRQGGQHAGESTARYCQQCGTRNGPGANYCQQCGAAL